MGAASVWGGRVDEQFPVHRPEPAKNQPVRIAGRALRPSELVRFRLEAPLRRGFSFAAAASVAYGAAKPASGRVAGVEGRRGLQRAVRRHFRAVRRLAFAEMGARDLIFGQPTFFPGLTYFGFLTNGLRHGFLADRRKLSRMLKRTLPSIATAPVPCAKPRLFSSAFTLDTWQCRVPPSPPAIRGMRKPRRR